MPTESISKYEAVIGLEVHAQLQTRTKLFSGDSASFGAAPNTDVSPIVLGHPGTLPRMNKLAIEHAIKMGLVCGCQISKHNYFARKNYFYPDLPKGYQISQHTTPICSGGKVIIRTEAGEHTIKLTRIHLEEDAGKSIHDLHEGLSFLDYNRAGVPLIEIVSEPEIYSAEEAAAYLTQIRKTVRWIGICDGNMEEGSLRCDANISVRLKGETRLGTRVEVKNLNSIKHVRHAISLEVERLVSMLERGEEILQETRSYDAERGITMGIRTKEDAEDYRYFPEPDLAPFDFSDEFIASIRDQLPAMPEKRKQEYQNQFLLSAYDAEQLTEEKALSDLFDRICHKTKHHKQLANLLIGPVRSILNTSEKGWSDINIPVENWNALLELIASGQLSFSTAAQKIIPVMLETPEKDPMAIAKNMDLIQDADEDQTISWIHEVLSSMPDKVQEYRKGKKGLIGLFVGEVKRVSKGKADPKISTALLNQLLNQN